MLVSVIINSYVVLAIANVITILITIWIINDNTLLTTVVFASPCIIETISEGLFMNAGSLVMSSLPDSVKYIEAYAFMNCDASGFDKFTISNNVEFIGREVFNGAVNLTKLTIPFVGAYRGTQSVEDADIDSTVFGWLFG